MLIGDLAARCKVTRRALRYYEQQGLLEPFRSATGYRTYGPEHIETVHRIRALLDAGFTSEEVSVVLPCTRGERARLEVCPRVQAEVEKAMLRIRCQADELAERQQSMERLLA